MINSSIYITGHTGFVGKNLLKYLKNYAFVKHKKHDTFSINENVVIHLIGKAHDLKKTSNPDDYYAINTNLTKNIFDKFLKSNARTFIMLSSVKAVADKCSDVLFENTHPNPTTHYGKSKLFAENYVLNYCLSKNKKVYILRPCMIYGNGNKGNLNLLYEFISKGYPWPLGSYNNLRSLCSIDNLNFIIKQLVENKNIPSGVYNVCDDKPISTIDLVKLISKSRNIKSRIISVPKLIIRLLAYFGDVFKIPINSERLSKLTENYVVSNEKIKSALKKNLPVDIKNGLFDTLKNF
jgi:nucleoside-diphosphate-sugar epimerase